MADNNDQTKQKNHDIVDLRKAMVKKDYKEERQFCDKEILNMKIKRKHHIFMEPLVKKKKLWTEDVKPG